jgi:hypothetical protein
VGSDFDFDFKSPSATENVIDKNTIDVVFSEKVNKTNAQTLGTNYIPRKLSAAADDTAPYAAVLQADGKTVRLSLSVALTPANYVLKLNTVAGATAIKDLAGNFVATNYEATFAGVADTDTTAPQVLSASYDAGAGKLFVNFNERMDNATFVKTGFSITDGTTTVTFTVNETGTWNAARTQLEIALSATQKAAVNALGVDKKLAIAANAVKDAALNGILAVSDVAVSAKTILSAAEYNEETNTLKLTFSAPVKVSTIKLGEFTLDGSVTRVLATATDTVKTKENAAIVEIEVGKNATLDAYEGAGVLNRNVDFTAAAGTFVDTNDVAVAATSDVALTYTKDTTAPTLVSASFNKTTNRLTLVFSEAVQVDNAANAYQPVPANVAFTKGAHLLTATECEQDSTDGVATSAKTLTFVDPTSSLTKDSKIYFTTAGAFKDDAGNKLAIVTLANAIPISYVDQTGPTATAAVGLTATTANLTFDKEMDRTKAQVAANYAVAMEDNPTVTIPVTAAYLNGAGTVVTLTFGSETTLGINYKITASNLTDTFGNPIQVGTGKNTAVFAGVGTVDKTGPSLAGVAPKFVDKDNSKSITAGDELVFTFDEALNIDFTKITATDYAIPSGRNLGANPVFSYGDANNQVKVVLGTAPTITWGDTLTPAATNNFKDLAGNMAQAVASGALANPGVAPKILTISYADTNASGAVDAGDKLTITYDRNITLPNGPAVLSAADFTLGGTLNFGTTPTFELVNGNQIIVTLGGTGLGVVVGTDTIDEAASVNIADEWGKTQAAADATTAKVTSADKTNPTVSAVAITKGTGLSGAALEATDKVTITLSEPVNKAGFDAGDFVLYLGATSKVYTGATSEVTVTGNTVAIEIKAADGWVGEAISAITTFNFSGATTTLSDASGNKAVPSAGFGVTVTKPAIN